MTENQNLSEKVSAILSRLVMLRILLNRILGLYGLIWSQPISDTCSWVLSSIGF